MFQIFTGTVVGFCFILSLYFFYIDEEFLKAIYWVLCAVLVELVILVDFAGGKK